MKQFWYHCSQKDHGVRWVPERRCPSNIGKSEPRTPRLCVAPFVPDCFVAALFEAPAPVHVYRTAKKYSGIKPRDVHDAPLTGERWLIPPVVLERVGTIDRATVADVTSNAIWFYRRYRIGLVKVKYAMLAEAWTKLGPAWHPKRAATLVPRLPAVFGGSVDDLWLAAAVDAELRVGHILGLK